MTAGVFCGKCFQECQGEEGKLPSGKKVVTWACPECMTVVIKRARCSDCALEEGHEDWCSKVDPARGPAKLDPNGSNLGPGA